MKFKDLKIGFALTGSFCTFSFSFPKIKELVDEGITSKENNDLGMYVVNPITNLGMDNSQIRLYKKNNRAQAYYIENDRSLDTDDLCESEAVSRPTRAC